MWDGIYSAAQAERGKATFAAYCGQCHMDDLSGANGPSLAGERFRNSWDAATLNDLFAKIKKSMPRNAPGSLKDADYLESITYILNGNGFPAGAAALNGDPDTLTNVQIIGKDGHPLPASEGDLVRTVGCLAAEPGGRWRLVSASVPVRTRDTNPSAGLALASLAALPSGSASFRLLAADPSPAAHEGHKMEAKGILIGDGIALNSLQMVSAACGDKQ